MKQTIVLSATALAALSLAACHPLARATTQKSTQTTASAATLTSSDANIPEAPMSPVPPKPPEAPSAPGPVKAMGGINGGGAMRAAFFVGELSDSDGDIQGCTTTLQRASSETGRAIFAEDGVDTNAVGFIRINDKLVKVGLVTSTPNDKGGIRVFASHDQSVRITETYRTGASHQESDSVDLTGTLVVTVNGESQTFTVSGGTAC